MAKKTSEEKAAIAKKPIEEVSYYDVTREHIIEYCKRDGNEEARAWLKSFYNNGINIYPKDENGKPDKTKEPVGNREPNFLEIKIAFYTKFLPTLAPKKKEKGKTMRELIMEL